MKYLFLILLAFHINAQMTEIHLSAKNEKVAVGEVARLYTAKNDLVPYLVGKTILGSLYIYEVKETPSGFELGAVTQKPLGFKKNEIIDIEEQKVNITIDDLTINPSIDPNQVKDFIVLDQKVATGFWNTWNVLLTSLLLAIIILGLLVFKRRQKNQKLKMVYEQKIQNYKTLIGSLANRQALEEFYAKRLEIVPCVSNAEHLIHELNSVTNQNQYKKIWEPEKDLEIMNIVDKLKNKIEFKKYGI